MKKNQNGTVSWAGRPIVDAGHITDLETAAALHEFRDRMPRNEAEDRAHTAYRRDHHLTGAAHHLNGMRAAQAAGQMEEAKKHGAMYALHLKALGEDPYAEPPAEVQQRSKQPQEQKLYRFKPHKADTFLLQDPPEMQKGEVIEFDKLAKKSEPQTMQQEPNMDKKTQLSQNLRKFWDEKHTQAEKAEKTNIVIETLYKAAKVGIAVMAKNEEGGDEPAPIVDAPPADMVPPSDPKPAVPPGSQSDTIRKAEAQIASERHNEFQMRKSEAKKKADEFWKKREGKKYDEPGFNYEE